MKVIISAFLKVQFSGIKYIHNGVRGSAPSISRTFYPVKLKVYSLNSNSLLPPLARGHHHSNCVSVILTVLRTSSK